MIKAIKTGSFTFTDGKGKNKYRLVRGVSSHLENTICIYVERQMPNDSEWGFVPSGWDEKNVKYSSSLCIDGGLNWNVYPTEEAWAELYQSEIEKPLTKVRTVMMSHLSDTQETGANNEILNFVKWLLLKFPDTNTEIDPDKEYDLFLEFQAKRKGVIENKIKSIEERIRKGEL